MTLYMFVNYKQIWRGEIKGALGQLKKKKEKNWKPQYKKKN